MMSFYTGRDARVYDKKFKFIVKQLLEEGMINARDNKKANSEAFRFMVDRFYEYLQEQKGEKKNG